MKGLLLKDWYMIQKYCRSYILITAVIIGISLANGENLFFYILSLYVVWYDPCYPAWI